MRSRATDTIETLPIGKLRRLALDRQGLLRRTPFGRGKRGTLRAIEHLGYVQIDTISVVARAHDHVLASRVPNYHPRLLDALQQERRVFEFWYHAAAYLPMRDFRFALPKMRAMAAGEDRWMRSRDHKLMHEVRARIAAEGPVRARELDGGARGEAGWWNWKPAKRAVEQLFMQGDLMVSGREGFQKVYDLTERVLPAGTDTTAPTDREMAAHLLEAHLRSHAFTTAKTVTHLRRRPALRSALKDIVEDGLAAGRLVALRLPTGETAYADAAILDGRAPQAPRRVRLLSPFDNAVIHRARTKGVFDFDYQLECYVTENKRQYGYFCLPILYGDRFVGRADCKAHRAKSIFEVKRLFVEDRKVNRDRNSAFAAALSAALEEFAEFNGCSAVEVRATAPRFWRGALDSR